MSSSCPGNLDSLRNKKDFDSLFRSCQLRLASKNFVLLAQPNQHQQPRVGFILPRKKICSAVMRNTIKRHAREYLRAHSHPWDYLLVARSKIFADEKKNCFWKSTRCSPG